MTVAQTMRRALKTYLDSVEATFTELSEIEELAQVYSKVIETNREINVEIENAVRLIGNLQAQRIELFDDYHNATFEGELERVEEIEHQRDEIDRKVAELQATVEALPSRLNEIDGTAIAELLQRVESVNVPTFCSGSIEWGLMKSARGTYQRIPPTGLVGELSAEHDKLVEEIGTKKRYIRDLQQWSKYMPKTPPTPAEIRLREALAARA